MSGQAPDTVYPLHGNQMHAVAPDETVWLSASAGTGKTQVLSARVLRLLLQADVAPSQILCLTFTKAGAAEMASRINDKLARWVRLNDAALATELKAIGADFGRDTLARARTLFAAVLDCPGGGLRIDTIHAFSQWLLAAFPHEADLVPGTRPMEDRERTLLAKQVLADLLVDAEANPAGGGSDLLDAVARLSLRMGPDEVEAYLLRCADARDAWFGTGSWQEPLRPRVLSLLGLPSHASEAQVAALCADAVFDVAALRRCLRTLADWDTDTGREGAAAIGSWLDASDDDRAAGMEALYSALFTKSNGAPKRLANVLKRDPDYGEHVELVRECIEKTRELQAMLALAEWLEPALRLGRAFALAWDEAKRREGVIDFDDQIRRAAALLGTSSLAEWIRYKLDRRFDHILVDEAQDTNAAQWRIIHALTGDFFTGSAKYDRQRGATMRTLFVVGDYKQAIFRFQGTSPDNFRKARDRVHDEMSGASENAAMLRSNIDARPLREYGLDRSFRTAQPVLDFVDRAIAGIGAENFGLAEMPDRHTGETRPGHVALWRPVGYSAADDEPEDQPEDRGEDGADEGPAWLSRPDRDLAERIALQVKAWTDPGGEGFALAKGGVRRATAGDVMILVRKRRELAGLIVARLHAHGVPVAGVDRLRLGAPLAVRDLIAALRFAAQPLDDLNLASLLVSPLIGWSQDQLLEHGWRQDGRLWSHLRAGASTHVDVVDVLDRLGELLALADFEPPQNLLHWLLVGPWRGRRRLVARLGREANDPIDELLNAARAYAAGATPSLAGFLNWFDAGEGELKREAENSGGLARVMTVHGAKGLQAPIVILADATGNPDAARVMGIDLPDARLQPDEERAIPLPALRKEERRGRIAEHAGRDALADAEEHWRLLYVAMTRAEEALFIGGALGSRDRGAVPENSWYAKLRALFDGQDELADPIWSGRLEHGDPRKPMSGKPLPAEPPPHGLPAAPLPSWAARPPAAEPRPPRPLAPSGLGEDETPDPPFPPGAGALAARRGTLIHKLLERLPEVAATERELAGARWLERSAADLAEAERTGILQAALTVIAHPDWSDLFGDDALAEVPIAVTAGERVIAGTIDRLLIEPGRVRIVDFKTARRPPETLAQVPRSTVRQMAAYAAALERAYPGRAVEAAVLYTAAPRLIPLSAAVLGEHKTALAMQQ